MSAITSTGSGTGLTAIADVSGGSVTGFEITSPGQGYNVGDQVTFTVRGASAATLATPASFTYTLQQADVATNGTGGLTKTGAGSLTLTGASTYAGGTTVSGGTMFANAPRVAGATLTSSATGTGTVVVAAGAVLGGTGGTGDVVVNGTVTAGPDGVAAGTLTTGMQTWNAGGGYVAKVDATGASDLLKLSA